MAKTGFLHTLKKRFSASPGKREEGEDGSKAGGGLGENHPQAHTIREAYTTVILEASEQGINLVNRKDEAIKTAAILASRWTGTEITPEDVSGVVGKK